MPRETQLLEGVPQGAVPLRDAPEYAAQSHRRRSYRRRRRGAVLRERRTGWYISLDGGTVTGTRGGCSAQGKRERKHVVRCDFYLFVEEGEDLAARKKTGCDAAGNCRKQRAR